MLVKNSALWLFSTHRTVWPAAKKDFAQTSRPTRKQATDNTILPLFQVFAGNPAGCCAGVAFGDSQNDTKKGWNHFRALILASSPVFLSWKLHILFIYYLYADKFQTHVSTSDLFCSAQRPALITSEAPSVPPASPQNELLEFPSKCHKRTLQNTHNGTKEG